MAQASGRIKVLCSGTNELILSLQHYFESQHWKFTIQHYLESDLPKRCYVCKSEISPVYFHHKTRVRLGHERLTDIMPICSSCFEQHQEDKARRNGKKKSERFLLHQFGFNPNLLSVQDKDWLLCIHPHKRSHILSNHYRRQAGKYQPSSHWINQQVKYTCRWIRKFEKEMNASVFEDV